MNKTKGRRSAAAFGALLPVSMASFVYSRKLAASLRNLSQNLSNLVLDEDDDEGDSSLAVANRYFPADYFLASHWLTDIFGFWGGLGIGLTAGVWLGLRLNNHFSFLSALLPKPARPREKTPPQESKELPTQTQPPDPQYPLPYNLMFDPSHRGQNFHNPMWNSENAFHAARRPMAFYEDPSSSASRYLMQTAARNQ